MIKPVRKAVFPVAGLGTRFLPATKAIPKELLPVVDKPVLQYVVEEAAAAGIEHFVFVTGRGKSAIEDHFDSAFELEATLESRAKESTLAALREELPTAGSTSFTRQQAPLGLGHAIWCARHIVGDEPFAVLLPDMLMRAGAPCLATMMGVYAEAGGNVISVEACEPEATARYGIVGVGEELSADAFRITAMVEKPRPAEAPSNLYISGRYILQPEIFPLLGSQPPGAGGEIQVTDAMKRLAETQAFTGVRFRGTTFDCGSKLGFLKANIAFALERTDLSPDIVSEIRALLPR
jgi:UTP--glucose-1-phosphate uridylyltransferase